MSPAAPLGSGPCARALHAVTLSFASGFANLSAITKSLPLNSRPAMLLIDGLKAIASPTRLRVLQLLKNPAAFDGPRDRNGRPIGVTAKALLKHIRCRQPSLNEQMSILIGLGLVEARRVGRWVVYTRDEERIRQLKQTIIDQLLPPATA